MKAQKKVEEGITTLTKALFENDGDCKDELQSQLADPRTRADIYDAWCEVTILLSFNIQHSVKILTRQKLFVREQQHHGDSRLIRMMQWFNEVYQQFMLGVRQT